MSVTRWITGCMFAALLAAPAAAFSTDLSTQNLGDVQQPASAPAAPHSPGSDPDAAGLSRSTDTNTTSNDSRNDGGGSVPTSTSARQSATHHSNVGWQSLLPGSIQ